MSLKYLIPSPVTYTVTFDSNGGSDVPSQEVESGNKATKPSDPVKDGFTFDGWLDNNGNTFNFDTPIMSNITLYANWKGTTVADQGAETNPSID